MLKGEDIADEFLRIQDEICTGLEVLDGKGKFREDKWEREGGGGGRTRIIEEGALLEKGGVNFSKVYGTLPDVLVAEYKAVKKDFLATGVSIVLHPHNPHVPIIHMNIRYFELGDGQYWFGGGIDLTPHFINKEQAGIFHRSLKQICDKYGPDYYLRYKNWADDYFFIPHRNETRGIGGIFFDQVKPSGEKDKTDFFRFVCELGRSFVRVYEAQAEFGRYRHYTAEEKNWQLLRRGRYVEFNLVYDRGTKFGLQTSGRIESILMSLPKHASWLYDFHPEKGSPAAETLLLLKKGVSWTEF